MSLVKCIKCEAFIFCDESGNFPMICKNICNNSLSHDNNYTQANTAICMGKIFEFVPRQQDHEHIKIKQEEDFMTMPLMQPIHKPDLSNICLTSRKYKAV